MNTEMSSACKCFGVYDEERIVAFMGVLHQPHSINRKIKRVSRMVVLPDYQGIGIGYQFLNIIAQKYIEHGYDFTIVTSAKNLISKLYHSAQWRMYNVGTHSCSSIKNAIDYKRASIRDKCKTASFKYKGVM